MLDSALEIRGEGRGWGGGDNPDPYILGGRSPPKFFGHSGLSLVQK